ncbi:MAG: DUF5686 family protein [Balneolaceae bacterium]|nr:DUF5686 family protein [Balneolaceae bacterium]
MKYFFGLALLFTLFPVTSYPQHDITGRVYDAETDEALPSATVLVEDTYNGTVSNQEGYFSISVESVPVTLVFRYIGYESKKVDIDKPAGKSLSIGLNPSVTVLDEIVVTGEDPGLSIMERVIERKKIWRADLETYRAEAYTRQVISNDTSIVSISESSSVLYWDQDKGIREVQISREQTSNLSESQNFAGVNYLPNFYDDDVEIAGFNMVGITHPNALDFYHFRLLDTAQMDGKPVYKIEVIPKRKRQPTFEGTAWVLGRDYALLEVELKPNEVVNFPPPVRDFVLFYNQQYSNYGRDYWLPVDMRVEGEIQIGMVGLKFPPFRFSQLSRLTEYNINVTLPDSLYRKESVLTRSDSVGVLKDSLEIEPIPLTETELKAYQTIDSTQTFEEAFKPEGFLADMVNGENDQEQNGLLSSAGDILPDGLSPRLRFNRIEGYHLGLNYNQRFGSAGLSGEAFAGYSFHSKSWDAGIQINQNVFTGDQRQLEIFGGFRKGTDHRYESDYYTPFLNSFQTLFGGRDYFDYFKNERWSAGIEFGDIVKSADLRIEASLEEHSSFEGTEAFQYSLFGWHEMRRMNPQIDEGRLHSVLMELRLNHQDESYGFQGTNQFSFVLEHSSDFLGSDFDFTKYTGSLDLHFETFYSRRLFANTLDLHFSASTFSGDLPVQRQSIVDGSLNLFTPFGVFKTRRSLPYVGQKTWIVYGEHNFRTIPFELLGLRYPVDKGWSIIAFGGLGEVKSADSEIDPIYNSRGVHSEAGVSLNSIFGILRLDFAKRLDSDGFYIGLSVPRYF